MHGYLGPPNVLNNIYFLFFLKKKIYIDRQIKNRFQKLSNKFFLKNLGMLGANKYINN